MLNYFREKLYAKYRFARQSWYTKNSNFKKYKFNHLDLEYRTYGNKNASKFFYVIKRAPGAGFFSNLNFVIHNLLICDDLKMIPIIDMQNYQNFYNCKNKINNTLNSWNYYFKPVSKYSLEEVYSSKNVIICDNKTSAKGGFSIKNYISEFKYLNGFDKRYFLYMEDVDICRRIDEIGKKKLYYPKVEIIHHHQQGSSKSLKLFIIHTSSAIKYFLKWGFN